MTEPFDHGRMQADWTRNPLETPRNAARFIILMQDYMQHVRSLGPSAASEEAAERSSAETFLKWTNNGIIWPMIQQYVPELQQPAPDDPELSPPLRYILRGVKERLPPPPKPTPADLELAEEEAFVWARTAGRIRYLVATSHELGEAADKMKDELEELTELLRSATLKQRPFNRLVDAIKKVVYGAKGASFASEEDREAVDQLVETLREAVVNRAGDGRAGSESDEESGESSEDLIDDDDVAGDAGSKHDASENDVFGSPEEDIHE